MLQKWIASKAEFAARGEIIGSPSLEMYGHHYDDPPKVETTFVGDLRAKPACSGVDSFNLLLAAARAMAEAKRSSGA